MSQTQRKSSSGSEFILSGNLVAIDLANVAAASVLDAAFLVPGSQVGDIALVSPNPAIVNLSFGVGVCRVAGTVQVPVTNPTAGAINPAAQDFKFSLQRT